MRDLPPVSIVIPTLNEERYIPILLNSICELKHDLEVIVVDAHSDDETVAVVESFRNKLGDKPLTVINSDVRLISKQRNAGARVVKHDLILFCDADIKMPSNEEYEKMISEFAEGNYGIATSQITSLEANTKAVHLYYIAYVTQRIMATFGRIMASGNFILISKRIFEKIGGFDETLRISEDVDLSLRAAKHCRFKLFSVPIKVSCRRGEKYGYSWIKKNPKAIYTLLTKGRLTEKDNVFYPFGDF